MDWRPKCSLSHHRMGRYVFHNTEKQNSVSRHTKCYYFSYKKSCALSLVHCDKPVHTNNVLQCSLVTGQTDRPTHLIQTVWELMLRRLFSWSRFYSVTEICSITLNTSAHTLIYSIYTFILCNVLRTLPLRAPLIPQPDTLCFLQLTTDLQFY